MNIITCLFIERFYLCSLSQQSLATGSSTMTSNLLLGGLWPTQSQYVIVSPCDKKGSSFSLLTVDILSSHSKKSTGFIDNISHSCSRATIKQIHSFLHISVECVYKREFIIYFKCSFHPHSGLFRLALKVNQGKQRNANTTVQLYNTNLTFII